MKTILTNDPILAGEYLKKGKIVIFPTETVYGMGASSRSEEACKKIYQIKSRPIDNPFIVHVSSLEEMERIGVVAEHHRSAIQHLIPGPISFILPKKDLSIFSTNLPTIGIRIPSDPMIQKMLSISGPVSAPSANVSGKPSLTHWEDVVEIFDGKVDLILKGNEPVIGIESTVLDLSGEIPILLRPGKITEEELQELFPKLQTNATSTIKPISPGLKYRHYSPDCKVELLESTTQIPNNSFGFIGFETPKDSNFTVLVKNNLEYMKNLYKFFIDCDKKKLTIAYCQMPQDDKWKKSLLNRLEKAISKK